MKTRWSPRARSGRPKGCRGSHEPRRGGCPHPPSRAELDKVLIQAKVAEVAELRSAGQMRTSAPTWFMELYSVQPVHNARAIPGHRSIAHRLVLFASRVRAQ